MNNQTENKLEQVTIDYSQEVDVSDDSTYRAVSSSSMIESRIGEDKLPDIELQGQSLAKIFDEAFVENLTILDIKHDGNPISVEFSIFDEDPDKYGMKVAGITYPFFGQDYASFGINQQFLTRFLDSNEQMIARTHAELIFRIAHEFAHIKAYLVDPAVSRTERENTERRNRAIEEEDNDTLELEVKLYEDSPVEQFCDNHGLKMMQRKINQLKASNASEDIIVAFQREYRNIYDTYFRFR